MSKRTEVPKNTTILFLFALSVLLIVGEAKVQLINWTKWPSPEEKVPSYTLTPKKGSLPVYRTGQDVVRLGPVRQVEVYETEHHLYKVPFHYKNVTLDNWLEYSDKGMEMLADVGTITIVEEKPIVSLTIVGSGCCSPNYNIVEWWGPDENISRTHGQLVKRSRIDNLKGMHNAWLQQALSKKQKFDSVEEANKYLQTIREVVYAMTSNYYRPGSIMAGLYENTAYFRIGDVDSFEQVVQPGPNTIKVVGHYDVHKVVIRCGGMDYENPGCAHERYPADYAVRLIDIVVKK
jgi:hypothetical protein